MTSISNALYIYQRICHRDCGVSSHKETSPKQIWYNIMVMGVVFLVDSGEEKHSDLPQVGIRL